MRKILIVKSILLPFMLFLSVYISMDITAIYTYVTTEDSTVTNTPSEVSFAFCLPVSRTHTHSSTQFLIAFLFLEYSF